MYAQVKRGFGYNYMTFVCTTRSMDLTSAQIGRRLQGKKIRNLGLGYAKLETSTRDPGRKVE